VAYPELQLLRSFAELQSALHTLSTEHARQAAAAAQEAAAAAQQQQQRRKHEGGGNAPPTSAASGGTAALRAAYQKARRPVMDLLGLPLAPASLRIPLLRFVAPLLETGCMPFGRGDVQRLLQVLGATLALQAAAKAEGVAADDGGGGGGAQGAAAGEEGAGGVKVGEVRLALARALARAHIVEASSTEA